MRASFIRNTRHHAKRVDASVDGVSDRGSTPLASTISKKAPQVGPPACGVFVLNWDPVKCVTSSLDSFCHANQIPARFGWWLDFILECKVCSMPAEERSHDIRVLTLRGQAASLTSRSFSHQFHVLIAEVPIWLAGTPRSLASVPRKRRVWRRFHRPSQGRAFA
jgi:hypothetical protein